MALIAHLDLDAFFATVETLEHGFDPEKPLVVGGNPRGRGVVATANYAARKYGIRSGMSAAEALRRCPQATFIRPSKGLYGDYSRRVWAIVAEFVPQVERLGPDEGYLELGTDDLEQAVELAHWIKASVYTETKLTASIGIATNKTVSKVASDRNKPSGITPVPAGEEAVFLAPLAVRLLPGVGPKAEERLDELGITTIGELAGLTDAELEEAAPGKWGVLVRDRARGIDERPVSQPAPAKQVSREETFPVDVADRDVLRAELQRMADEIGELLESRGVGARTVTLKLRYPDFTTQTRARTLPVPTDEPRVLYETACFLLERAIGGPRCEPIRLVGISASGFARHSQLSLL
jgi:DNA polymerase-4